MDGLWLLSAAEVMLLACGWAAPAPCGLWAQIGTHLSSLCSGVGIFQLCQQRVTAGGAHLSWGGAHCAHICLFGAFPAL